MYLHGKNVMYHKIIYIYGLFIQTCAHAPVDRDTHKVITCNKNCEETLRSLGIKRATWEIKGAFFDHGIYLIQF